MKEILLYPNQIIALNDPSLYSKDALRSYFEISKKGPLPACLVLHASNGIPYFKGENSKTIEYNKKFAEFLGKHPKAEYFLLDGNHKTTAATLTHKQIPAILIEKKRRFR